MMGALNAGLFVIGTRASLVASAPPALRAFLGLALLVYGALAVHFLLQAIEVLRPRKFRPRLYGGLRLMTVLAAVVLMALVGFALTG